MLTELIPETLGQIGEHIVLSSTQPLSAQEVFGNSAATLLSAVPPAIVQWPQDTECVENAGDIADSRGVEHFKRRMPAQLHAQLSAAFQYMRVSG